MASRALGYIQSDTHLDHGGDSALYTQLTAHHAPLWTELIAPDTRMIRDPTVTPSPSHSHRHPRLGTWMFLIGPGHAPKLSSSTTARLREAGVRILAHGERIWLPTTMYGRANFDLLRRRVLLAE